MTEDKKPTTKRPTAAKQPQDRKPKQEVTAESEVNATPATVTLRGVEWKVDPHTLEDFEILAWIAEIDAGGPDAAFAAPLALKRILGDQWPDAMAVLRDSSTGRVHPEAGAEFLLDLLQALAPNS